MADHVRNAPHGFDWVKRLTGWRVEGGELVVTGELALGGAAEVRLSCLSARAWRMTFSPSGTALPELPILAGPVEPLPLEVEAGPGCLQARAGEYLLQIERDPWCLSLRDRSGREVLGENPNDVDGLNRLFILPLGFVRGPQGEIERVTESFHLRPDERLYGLGEKFTRLDKVGQRVTSWTLDALGAASERSYKNVPFLLSSAGYGLFLNTGRRVTFDLGTESCETYTVTLDGPYLDLFLMAGETPADLLEVYTGLTGRAPVPPKWSFGLWLSGCGVYRDEAAIRRLVAGVEAHELPCDVIHIDPWWMRWRKYADFEWDREAFPDPEGLIADLHARGLRLSVWQHPYISIESELYEQGRREGYFVLRPDGEVYLIDYGLSLSTLPGGVTGVADERSSWNARVAIIDLTHPAAVEWYKGLMRPVLRMGLDVFKTDFGEDIPADACFANGQTGAEMHNLYPLVYNRAVFEATEEVRGEGLVWARSGWAGSQRYPVCWSGDPASQWDSLAFTLRGGLSLGLSGVPFWSHDVGGYRGHPSEKLYIRWAQFGLFCSHTRCHGESAREPWHFGERAAEIFRRYARLRYSLFPYLYSCAHEAARTGLPMLRAMPLAFPDDPAAAQADLQYMLGPWLLVAPIYTEDDRRSVYLPEGEWLDYWTGEALRGPRSLAVEAPLERLPLYVRAGAVIPSVTTADRIPLGRIDPLILDVYPSESSSYRLLEDEGETEIEGSLTAGRLDLAWSGPFERAVILRLHLAGQPADLRCLVDGVEVTVSWRRLEGGAGELSIPRGRSARLRVQR